MPTLVRSLTAFILWFNKLVEPYVYRVVDDSAAVIFPTIQQTGYPDYKTAKVADNMINYMKELPPKQHLMLNMMYLAFDFFPVLFLFSHRRFRNLSLEKRSAFIKKLDNSRLFIKRLLADGLKANQRMIFLCDTEVLDFVGEFRLKSYPSDSIKYNTKPARYLNRGSMKVLAAAKSRSGLVRKSSNLNENENLSKVSKKPAAKKLKFA